MTHSKDLKRLRSTKPESYLKDLFLQFESKHPEMDTDEPYKSYIRKQPF